MNFDEEEGNENVISVEANRRGNSAESSKTGEEFVYLMNLTLREEEEEGTELARRKTNAGEARSDEKRRRRLSWSQQISF